MKIKKKGKKRYVSPATRARLRALRRAHGLGEFRGRARRKRSGGFVGNGPKRNPPQGGMALAARTPSDYMRQQGPGASSIGASSSPIARLPIWGGRVFGSLV